MRQKRDEIAFQLAKGEFAEFLAEPDLNVVYFDEAGFSLKGVVPYGWQTIGERYEIPVTGAYGSNLQTLGFQGQDRETHMYVHKGYVNSEMVISIFDDYCQTLEGPAVVVLDNASVHKSAAFQARLEVWAEHKLFIYYLPPYSPELNAIECFWKKLKYQLLPAEAWARFSGLLETLTKTLNEFGEVSYMPSLFSYAE